MTDIETVKDLPLNSIPQHVRENLCDGFIFPDNMTVWQVSQVFTTRAPFTTTEGLYFIDNKGDIIASDTHPGACDVAHAPGNLKEAQHFAINDTPMPLDNDTVENISKYICNAFTVPTPI